MNFYVYSHIRPDTDTIFYIGKGIGNRSHRSVGRNPYWHNIVNKNNGEFIVNILHENLNELESYKIEANLIRKYGRVDINTGVLCNLSDGMDGGTLNFSSETLDKISKAHKGKILSQETKDKISKNRSGIVPVHINRKIWLENCSKAQRGKIITDNTKAKISETLLNHNWSEHRKKFGREILQFSKNGIFIKEWESVGHAASTLKINRPNIISVLNTKRNTSGGFSWKYK